MGGLQAAEPPKDQSPDELAAIWKKLQEENEKKRAMAMNETPGWMPAQQGIDRDNEEAYHAISRLLQGMGGF